MTNQLNENRDQFSSRLGFILIAAGCSIGLGNIWRFPYITGQYGGALFVGIYVIFLLVLGIPLVTIELAVGRASKKSLGASFESLTPNTRWYLCKYFMIFGNYVLMAFYSMVTGWVMYYTYKIFKGDFTHSLITQKEAGEAFGAMLSNPTVQIICTVLVTVISFSICAFGFKKGVEGVTKPLMVILFFLLIFLSVRSAFLPGFEEGMKYYLYPDFSKVSMGNLHELLSAACGQAFFTLGVGVGSLQIFGSYMNKKKSIVYESTTIAILDTIVAILAGIIIFPACFSYGVEPGQGPGLVFVTLVSVFSNMAGGQIWGGIFFLFLLLAAGTTLIAVFENIIGISKDMFKVSRIKAVVVNCIVILILGLPVILGFNVWSDIHPFGGDSVILDLYDFILSQNIIEIGSIIYVLYASWKFGWGYNNFISEVNQGTGFKLSNSLHLYFKFLLPLIVVALLIQGYISIFTKYY